MKKILFASFESLPFVKTGGLADVIYALPKAISKELYHVRVVLPLHKSIKEKYIQQMKPVGHIHVRSGYIQEEANVLSYFNEGIEYLFIENDTFFYRDGIYGYQDDASRFSFFNLAILEMMIQLDDYPDVIHAHDYHTGLISALAKLRYQDNSQITRIKHVYTIHNLAYQGIFDKQILFDVLGFNYWDYENGSLRYGDATNFMKIGISFADTITTVSNTYAQEIQTPLYGEGLENLIAYRKDDLCGVVNGIDVESFNPKTDPYLFANYSKDAFKRNKHRCKRSLQYDLGLEDKPNTFVVGLVSRLTNQKGISMLIAELEHILAMDVQVVILGTGDRYYENVFKAMEDAYKGKAVYYCGYNEALAHKIYAGIDLLLMPSFFEPCGISQLIAMRYGTLPLVRETGGLKDTVIPYNCFDKSGTGFSFDSLNPYDFKKVFDLAYDLFYNNKADWYQLVKQAMSLDVSFQKSAKDYENIYEWTMNK